MNQFNINDYPNAKKALIAWLWEQPESYFGDSYFSARKEEFHNRIAIFLSLPLSMQFGVLVDWLETEDMYVTIVKHEHYGFCADINNKLGGLVYRFNPKRYRNEAREAVLTKSFEIIEGRNK